MSDARTDFFDSGAKNAKPPPSRDDFFAGKINADDDFEEKEPSFWQRFSKLAFAPSPESLLADKLTPEQIATAGIGAAEGAASGATAIPAALAGGLNMSASLLGGRGADDSVARFNQTRNFLTYDPRTPLGDEAAEGIAEGQNLLGPAQIHWSADKLFDLTGSPMAATAAETGGNAALMFAGGKLARSEPKVVPLERPKISTPPSAQEVLNKVASSQSMGAAGAAVDLQKLSPNLKAAVTKAVEKTGGAVNPEAMARYIQADSLPVKVPLSEGQVHGDARLISEERNARGKTPGAVEAFAGQNKALVDNLRAFRDTAGEEVFSTSKVEHADTLIARYKEIDDARNADIGEKYKDLRDAAGGDFPVDAQALLANTRAALKKDLATSHAPPDVMKALEEHAASGAMTLEDFEGLRTSLARTQRSAADGQVRHAAGVIRNQIEAMPLQAGAEKLKGLADTARTAARERFQALEDDPAYKAAVTDSVAPDNFIQKFVVSDKTATRDNVAKLSAAMKDDPTAAQTLKVATLDHLRQAAGIDGSFNGNFTQAGYNKALRALEPKLTALLDPALVEHVQNLGDVARYSQLQPEGHFVNNSNTFVASAAEKAATVAEKMGNLAIPGLDAGTFLREKASAAAAAKKVRKSWDPVSGLTRLSDLTKLKEPK